MLGASTGRSTGLIIANTLAGAVLGFAALKVFAVYTGPHADVLLGQLAFAMGIAGMLSVTLDMGLGQAHIKRVSEGRDLARATGSYAAAKLVLAVAFVGVLLAGAWMGTRLGVLQDTTRVALAVVAVYFAMLGLRAIFTATFDGRREFAKSQLTLLVENVVRAPLMMLFALAFGGAVLGAGPLAAWMAGPGADLGALLRRHGVDALASVYALAAMASVLAGWLLFRRGYPVGPPEAGVVRDYWGFAKHGFLATVVGTIYVSMDKVLITAFWDASNTGQYFGAQRFSDLIGMVPLAMYTVLFPTLSGIYARGDPAQARAAMAATLRHVSLVVVPLVAGAFALASPLLSLVLTGEFTEAVPTLRALSLFALVYALMYPYATLLYALHRPDITAKAAIAATAVNLVLNLLLIPPAGTFGLPLPGLAELGAALATVVAVMVNFALLRAAAHRLEGPISLDHLPKHLLAGVLAAGVLLLLAPGPEGASWHVMAGLLLLGGLVYLAVLAALREFTRRDLDLYLHVLDPKTMARHVADEIAAHGPGAARQLGRAPHDPEERQDPQDPRR